MEKILSNITRFFLIIIIISLVFGIIVGFVCSSGIVTIDVHPQKVKEAMSNGANNLKNNSSAMFQSLRSQNQDVELNRNDSLEQHEQDLIPYRYDLIHIVQPGETLYDIGKYYGVDWKIIKRVNKIQEPLKLYPKEKLLIPIVKYFAEETSSYSNLN